MLSRSEEKHVRALGRRKGREREGRFLAEGVRVVEELLAAGLELDLVLISPSLTETERGTRLRDRLMAATDVREVSQPHLDELAATTTTQGVLAVAGVPRAALSDVRPGPSSVLLVLDGVQDPGNLGTLARSAAAFDCAALVCLPGTVDPWNAKAVRASAGALFRRPVVQVGVEAFAEWRTRLSFTTAGADAAGVAVVEARLEGRVALVVGNEGAGLSPDVARQCDQRVSVPMPGGTESLNVAVAGGILLYELTRKGA